MNMERSSNSSIFSCPLAVSILAVLSPKSARTIYNEAYAPRRTGAPTFAEVTDQARQNQLLGSDGQPNLGLIESELSYPLSSLADRKGVLSLRVACVSRAAGIKPDSALYRRLGSFRIALPLLASSIFAPDRHRIAQSNSRKLESAAIRAIVEQAALNTFRLDLPPPTAVDDVKDPLLLAILEKVTGSRDPKTALESALGAALKAPLIGSTANKWQTILAKCAIESLPMLQPRSSTQTPAEFIAALSSVLGKKAARTPSGWISIADAHEFYSTMHKITLGDFKALVAQAAVDELVEVSPISVGSLIKDDLRSRSELELGGLTYHFLRIRAPLGH